MERNKKYYLFKVIYTNTFKESYILKGATNYSSAFNLPEPITDYGEMVFEEKFEIAV